MMLEDSSECVGDNADPSIQTLIKQFNDSLEEEADGAAIPSVTIRSSLANGWPLRLRVVFPLELLARRTYQVFIDLRDVTKCAGGLDAAKEIVNQTNLFHVFRSSPSVTWMERSRPRSADRFWGVWMGPGELSLDLNRLAVGEASAIHSIIPVLNQFRVFAGQEWPK